jgi:hypothetical protein
MRYFFVAAALATLLSVASCKRGQESYTESGQEAATAVQEMEAPAPHPVAQPSPDPDKIARVQEEKKVEDQEEASENERRKLGELLNPLSSALFRENNVEKAKQLASEIGPLYEKLRKIDETSCPKAIEFMNNFKEQLDKLVTYLQNNDTGNARTCFNNLATYWHEWRKCKMSE